jgi:hypothetical protein
MDLSNLSMNQVACMGLDQRHIGISSNRVQPDLKIQT